jgi:hypothetical protein
MTTIVDLDAGQVLGVVDGRDHKGVGGLALRAAPSLAPGRAGRRHRPLRNGSRPKTLTTTVGDLNLKIPKLRNGSLFPTLLERRRRVDQALYAVVMEA